MLELLIINVTQHMPQNKVSGTITHVTQYHKECGVPVHLYVKCWRLTSLNPRGPGGTTNTYIKIKPSTQFGVI